MTKQELRKAYLKKRLLLSDNEYERQNILLSETFFKSVDISGVRILHAFLPIIKNHEPKTWLIISHVQTNYPAIKITIPRINADGEMTSYILDENRLETNSLGIPEPKGGILIPSYSIDMILVPLLAFDKQGHRVGYGKGYYDRFLKVCRNDSANIGLSFFSPEEKITDTYLDDFQLGRVVTPEKVYTF
jgi:5-formyltetrahydrofolate cyclo-ligase